jgi:hypothetical protein
VLVAVRDSQKKSINLTDKTCRREKSHPISYDTYHIVQIDMLSRRSQAPLPFPSFGLLVAVAYSTQTSREYSSTRIKFQCVQLLHGHVILVALFLGGGGIYGQSIAEMRAGEEIY